MSNWCSQFISDNEIALVSETVRKAELKTTGEIVPMIVRRSSVIGHIPMQLMLLWAVLLFGVYLGAENWWHNLMSPWWYMVGGILLTPVVLQFGRLDVIQRILTSDEDEEQQVFQRARLEFEDLKMRHTEARTGILVFVSIMEHRCVVLADEGIAQKLPADTWQQVVDKVISGVKTRKTGEGLISAIELCGDLLSQQFPAANPGNNRNELRNALIIKE